MLSLATMQRLTRGEITVREAFRLQAEEDALEPDQEHTVALLTQAAIDSLGHGFRSACRAVGLPLSVHNTRDGYAARMRRAMNVITWGVKWPQSMYGRHGRNVLYIENGLLGQNLGAYIDHAGYFRFSSIATEPQPDPTADEVARMMAHVARMGHAWFHGGDPSGPVLLACQMPRDGSVRYGNSPHDNGRGCVRTLIEETAKALPPSVPVVVRSHPRAVDSLAGIALPDGWTIDPGGPIGLRLQSCRSVVTISSTVATEAVACGVPVVTIGHGVFSNSGATIDATSDLSAIRAAATPDRPDEWRAIRYLCSVMRHQLPYSAPPETILAHPSFRLWAEKAGKAVPPTMTVDQARRRIKDSGNQSAIELLSAIDARYGTCRSCMYTRLDRQIIALAAGLQKPEGE